MRAGFFLKGGFATTLRSFAYVQRDVSPVRVFRDVTRGDGVNYPTRLHPENLSSKLGINSPGTKVYV